MDSARRVPFLECDLPSDGGSPRNNGRLYRLYMLPLFFCKLLGNANANAFRTQPAHHCWFPEESSYLKYLLDQQTGEGTFRERPGSPSRGGTQFRCRRRWAVYEPSGYRHSPPPRCRWSQTMGRESPVRASACRGWRNGGVNRPRQLTACGSSPGLLGCGCSHSSCFCRRLLPRCDIRLATHDIDTGPGPGNPTNVIAFTDSLFVDSANQQGKPFSSAG